MISIASVWQRSLLRSTCRDNVKARALRGTATSGDPSLARQIPNSNLIPDLSPNHCRVVCLPSVVSEQVPGKSHFGFRAMSLLPRPFRRKKINSSPPRFPVSGRAALSFAPACGTSLPRQAQAALRPAPLIRPRFARPPSPTRGEGGACALRLQITNVDDWQRRCGAIPLLPLWEKVAERSEVG